MKHSQDVLSGMQLVMGELPDNSRRVPLEVQIVEEVREGDITRQRLTFTTEPGDRCWAWLLTPSSRSAPGAAMLCLHQTTKIGKDEPAGLGGKPNLHYALELARRGYVTLSPDYPGYGEYKIDCYAMGYASATMKGIWNHIRAMDLLTSLPTVDAKRIGCIGHSLGGHNTLFVAAFDERIRVAVSSCGFTRFTWNDDEGRGKPGDLSDWCHAGYMPRIKDRYHCRVENMPFDFDGVLGVIAPRALFVNGPRRDFMRWEGVQECVELIEQEYARQGVPDRLGYQYPDCEHDFPPEVREEAYRFVDRILGQERN